MKKTLLALALAGTSTFAMADAWIYGGANIGQSDTDGDTGTTSGIHIGTGILPIIGLEVGYQNHGSINFNSYEADSSSFYFAVKPSIDFGPLHVYGKVGAHAYDFSANVSQQNDDGYDIMYGVGAEYFVIDMLSIGAGYQNFAMGDRDVGAFTLNATVHIF